MNDDRIETIESFLRLRKAKDMPSLWPALATDADERIRLCVAGRQDASHEALELLADDPDVRVRRQLSRNPGTPAHVLAKLAEDVDLQVRSGVASHRAASASVLHQLADEGELALDRCISQNTNACGSVLSRYLDAPDQLVRVNTVFNPNLGCDDLWRFAEDPSAEVRRRVFERLRQQAEIRKVIARFLNDRNRGIREAIAADRHTGMDALETLSRDEDHFVRRQIALNPGSSAKILETLSRDGDGSVRNAVASAPFTPPSLLVKLAGDEDDHVRAGVAGNENTPYEILKFLAKDEGRWVRKAVAENKSLTLADLVKFFGATPADPRVGEIRERRRIHELCAIAANPNTPEDTLAELARSGFNGVHACLAENPALPVEAMECLGQRAFVPTMLKLLERNDLPENLRAEIMRNEKVRQRLAYSKTTPLAMLEKWCTEDRSASVLEFLASNRRLRPDSLAIVGRHSNDDVRTSVAGNPNASAETLRLLCADKVEGVRAAAAANPGTPADALDMLARDVSGTVRSSLIRNPNLPETAIRKLAEDEDRAIRKKLLLSLLAISVRLPKTLDETG